MAAFWVTAQQVLVLFILIIIGVICGKKSILSESSIKGLTNLVLYFVTPCVLIKSFVEIPFSAQKIRELGLVLLVSVLLHVGMILLTLPLIKDTDPSRERMLRFAVIFSNAGFMGLPLQEALLAEEGAFYAGTYIAVFNIFVWTYGLYLMSGNKKDVSPKKALLSPGVLGVLMGFILFLIPSLLPQFTLPDIVMVPVRHLAALNTPLPMIIIGYYLAQTDLKTALRDTKSFFVIILRILIVPLIAVGILYVCGMRGNMLVSLAVSVATPTATLTTMFAAKYDRHPISSCGIVSLSTLLSMVTIPLVAGLAQMLA